MENGKKQQIASRAAGLTSWPALDHVARALPSSILHLLGFPPSQHPCLPEGEVAGLTASRHADDDMVEHRDLKDSGGLGKAAREAMIRLGG